MKQHLYHLAQLAVFTGLIIPGVKPAAADSVMIWPIQPVMTSSESATALWLENQGRVPLRMQLRIFAWQQIDGTDQYQEQNAILSSPPMMEIASGERQMVRLIRQKPTMAGHEDAWRVILDEIPVVQDPAARDSAVRGSLGLQMRYSLPFFTYGQGLSPDQDARSIAAQLEWQVVTGAARQLFLEVINHGPIHGRLTDATFSTSPQAKAVSAGPLGDVLAHSTMRWPLGAVTPGQELHAKVNGLGPVTLKKSSAAVPEER